MKCVCIIFFHPKTTTIRIKIFKKIIINYFISKKKNQGCLKKIFILSVLLLNVRIIDQLNYVFFA